jgi:tetratricopeptide (TPR) repeat protein
VTGSPHPSGMPRWPLGALLLVLFGCHGLFGDRTDEGDKEIASFAEARQRAATFYDGGDYVRAAAQYREALKIRSDHFMCRLGLAYSLMFNNQPSTLLEAEKEFKAIGERRDPKEEVKRVYGLGLTYRTLAAHYQRRSRLREGKGQVKGAAEDLATSREYAQKGIAELKKVMEIDEVLIQAQDAEAKRRKIADPNALTPYRVSASLTPDAHLGIAHCEILLMDPSHPEELRAHAALAKENLLRYSEVAANARQFWQLERERLLVVDPMDDQAPAAVPDEGMKKRYEEKIANTIRQEVAVRRVLFDTLVYVNLYPEAIEEANTILNLDPDIDEMYRLRARAYLFLQPPDRRAALKDLKEYRSRLPVGELTDEMVQVNRAIKQLEKEIDKDTQVGTAVTGKGS